MKTTNVCKKFELIWRFYRIYVYYISTSSWFCKQAKSKYDFITVLLISSCYIILREGFSNPRLNSEIWSSFGHFQHTIIKLSWSRYFKSDAPTILNLYLHIRKIFTFSIAIVCTTSGWEYWQLQEMQDCQHDVTNLNLSAENLNAIPQRRRNLQHGIYFTSSIDFTEQAKTR
jgi:hypothetical protein